MMRAFVRWFRRSWITQGADGEGAAPLEAVAWRLFGLVALAAFIAITLATHPYPRLQDRGALVLAAFVAFVVFAIAAHPERQGMPAPPPDPGPPRRDRRRRHTGRLATPRRVGPRPVLRGDRRGASFRSADRVAHLPRRDRPLRGRLSGQGPGRRRGHVFGRDPALVLRHAAAPLPRRSARRVAGLPGGGIPGRGAGRARPAGPRDARCARTLALGARAAAGDHAPARP